MIIDKESLSANKRMALLRLNSMMSMLQFMYMEMILTLIIGIDNIKDFY